MSYCFPSSPRFELLFAVWILTPLDHLVAQTHFTMPYSLVLKCPKLATYIISWDSGPCQLRTSLHWYPSFCLQYLKLLQNSHHPLPFLASSILSRFQASSTHTTLSQPLVFLSAAPQLKSHPDSEHSTSFLAWSRSVNSYKSRCHLLNRSSRARKSKRNWRNSLIRLRTTKLRSLPSNAGTIHFNKNFRLDMQGVSDALPSSFLSLITAY
jgi:hypothetical protein